MAILNVDEIRSALQGLANAYPDIATLVMLREKTYECQESYALVIGRSSRCRAGVMITGGMHAREWGGPDLCVYFAADLLEAYTAGAGLTYGKKTFDAGVIRAMIERMTVVIFPCVNPDGVRYSHVNNDADWRKNRNPASSTTDPSTIGVDICRNFDFLWDYKTAFDPAAIWSGMASDQPSSKQFHGKDRFSEPESRNVRWLLDQHPEVTHYLDLHSFSGFVLYPWGDDENQFSNPLQNFRNSGWNGKRGVLGPPYGEYMCWFENRFYVNVTRAISAAIAAVRGTIYSVHQLFLMAVFDRKTYPTSGASFDWVYSRHLVDRSKRKVWGFGMEFSKAGKFGISYDELVDLAPEVTAGLVEFCRAATPSALRHILCGILGFLR
jgi:murein tripeptide amidase MpaA